MSCWSMAILPKSSSLISVRKSMDWQYLQVEKKDAAEMNITSAPQDGQASLSIGSAKKSLGNFLHELRFFGVKFRLCQDALFEQLV